MLNNKGNGTISVIILVGVIAIIILTALYAVPKYKVYSKRMNGVAQLQEAESNRQIAVLEAKARVESAKLEAQAEVYRAEGLAKANKIIGGSLKGKEEYLKYLYITGLKESNDKVVYIPTEAMMPIMEAGRLNSKTGQ